MNERQFIAKLRKPLGRRASYRVDPSAPTAEQRAAYKSVLPDLQSAEAEAQAAMRARREELLSQDPVYHSLVERWKEARSSLQTARGACHRHRVTAGVAYGLGLHVKAEGDTLHDVIDNLEKRREAA